VCLSTVYERKNGAETLVLNDVCTLSAEEGRVTVTDIMGEKAVVSGMVKSVDLMRNIIFVEAADLPG
jgi:predicted RNA-binding protein